MSGINAKNWISMVGVLFLLIILPGGSWYYLRSGLNYRLAALEELKDYGKIPVFGNQLRDGQPLTEEEVKGKTVITAFYGDGTADWIPELGQILLRLHQQFDKRDDVMLLVYTPANATEKIQTGVTSFIADYELTDTLQCVFVTANQEEIKDKATAAYQLPAQEVEASGATPFLTFTDRKMTIRKYYDIRDDKQIKNLVEHVAMLLPKKKERDLVFRREKEK